MKIILKIQLLFALVYLPSISYSQSDSLIQLSKNGKTSTIRLEAFQQLFFTYELSDPERALSFLDAANKIALKEKDSTQLAKNLIFYGYYNEDVGNYKTALKKYEESLAISKKTGDKYGMANGYNSIGRFYLAENNLKKSLANFQKALKIHEAVVNAKKTSGIYWSVHMSKYEKAMSDVYNNIASVFLSRNDYPNALENDLKALKIREFYGDPSGISYSLNNIGNIYSQMGDLKNALKYHLMSLECKKKLKDERAISKAYNNLGSIYSDLRNYPKAMECYKASLEIKKRFGDATGILISHCNMGDVMRKADNPEGAMKEFQLCLGTKEIQDHKDVLAVVYCGMGSIFVSKNKLGEAEKYLLDAKAISLELDAKDILRDVCFELRTLYIAKKDFKKALQNTKYFVTTRNQINSEDIRKKTIRDQMNYEFQKREAIIKSDNIKIREHQANLDAQKSKQQKITLWCFAGGLALVAVCAILIFRSLRIARTQKTTIENQKRAVETQKHIVEEKQKEILDSIKYARRIQTALLPSQKYIRKQLTKTSK
jgi:tetratricopeptide (TPR) repeat protein